MSRDRLYLVLEGPDGGGKSEQAMRLCDWVRQSGTEVLHVREPGSTAVGEALRELLLRPDTGELSMLTEALLFFAARAELIEKQIAPALRSGQTVVAERCFLSTVVYQGLAPATEPGVPVPLLNQLARAVHGDWMPDAVFVLDVPPDVAATRRRRRTDDRFEERGDSYQGRVRGGYLAAAEEDSRIQVVDAGGTLESVQQELRRRVEAVRAERHA